MTDLCFEAFEPAEIESSNSISEDFEDVKSLAERLKSWNTMELPIVDRLEEDLSLEYFNNVWAKRLLLIANGDYRSDVRTAAAKVWVRSQFNPHTLEPTPYLKTFIRAIVGSADEAVRWGLLEGLSDVESFDDIRRFFEKDPNGEISSHARQLLSDDELDH